MGAQSTTTRIRILATALALALVAGFAYAAQPDTLVVFDSTAHTPGTEPEKWDHNLPSGGKAFTNYNIVEASDGNHLLAISGGTASWLELDLGEVDVSRYDTLQWTWRVNVFPETSWENKPDQNDFAMRIELVYDFSGGAFPLNIFRKGLITSIFRGYPPLRVISYVWSLHVPAMEPYVSPDSSQTIIIPIEADTALVGRWISETHDILSDMQAHVPSSARCVLKSIRIRVDTDDTGSVAESALRKISLIAGGTTRNTD
jgi:hypothetical protein